MRGWGGMVIPSPQASVVAVNATAAGMLAAQNASASGASGPSVSAFGLSDDLRRVAFVFLRPWVLVLLFALGWHWNTKVFRRSLIDYEQALRLRKGASSTARPIAFVSTAGLCVLSLFFPLLSLRPVDTRLCLVGIWAAFALLGALFLFAPGAGYEGRVALRHALFRCAWPAPMETPFIEILVADGLTSISKILFDLGLGTCMLATSVVNDVTNWARLERTCDEQSFLPYLAWALPFMIRANQTWISSKQSIGFRRLQHSLNFFKYVTALPVIYLAMMYARRSATPTATFYDSTWALASLVNALYSLIWDVVMDWGLFFPSNCSKGPCLRYVLLFPAKSYYAAMVLNFLGRALWSLRWSPFWVSHIGSVELSTGQQALEVCRRLMWNIIRVEWEVVKNDRKMIDA